MGSIPVHWPPSTHNSEFKCSISSLESSAPCTLSFGFPREGLPDCPPSEPGQTVDGRLSLLWDLRHGTSPWPLGLSNHQHYTKQQREHLHTWLFLWTPPGATCAYSNCLQVSHRGVRQGLAAHKEVLVYAGFFFCECIYLLLNRKASRFCGEK